MCELQDRLHSVDGEGNEWKTRYETQTELNGQLQRQTATVRGKLEDVRGNPVGRRRHDGVHDHDSLGSRGAPIDRSDLQACSRVSLWGSGCGAPLLFQRALECPSPSPPTPRMHCGNA
ncbi:hypothetical protein CRUP_021824 [Coryphaenoides rupestris]|nr:hypothetical protein CRUP_021824 [Coryphaenoides rupestris]